MSFGYSRDDVVIERQDETAVFWNESGDVSIVQANWPEGDAVILINRSSLAAFWMRLKQMDEEGCP